MECGIAEFYGELKEKNSKMTMNKACKWENMEMSSSAIRAAEQRADKLFSFHSLMDLLSLLKEVAFFFHASRLLLHNDVNKMHNLQRYSLCEEELNV